MKHITLSDMNIDTDKPQIMQWDSLYQGTPEYNSIYEFVLENGLMRNLGEIIEINHERYPIGDDEIKKALIAKTSTGDIAGFILIDAYDLSSQLCELFIQYIVINPKYQHQGYGEAILNELLHNPENYIGAKPSFVFSAIDKNNIASQNLYRKMGFNFRPYNHASFLQAYQNTFELSSQPGE